MRLTLREREIIEFLKKNPLISQDELAKHFGLSRSSVAVHISNLMKKGVIQGRGYVFNEQVDIVIIGITYLDVRISGSDSQTMVDVDYSGLPLKAGDILMSFGINPAVITLVGNDDLGRMLIKMLQKKHLSTSNVYKHPGKRTCRRVLSDAGTMIEEGYGQEDLEKAINNREWIAFNCEWLIVDQAFQKDILRRVKNRDEDKVPYLCTCNIAKEVEDIPDHLKDFDTVVIEVENSTALETYRNILLKAGWPEQQKQIITDGKSGILYTNSNSVLDYPLPPNQCFTNEDSVYSLLTGIVYGLSSGYTLRQAIRIGAGLASAGGNK